MSSPLVAMLKELGAGFNDTTGVANIGDLPQGLKYMGSHPGDSLELLVKAMQTASQDQYLKGFQARTPVEALGHFLAGSLPGVGPAAAGVGENLAQGNVARGVGGLAGLFAPMAASRVAGPLLGEAVGKVSRAVEGPQWEAVMGPTGKVTYRRSNLPPEPPAAPPEGVTGKWYPGGNRADMRAPDSLLGSFRKVKRPPE